MTSDKPSRNGQTTEPDSERTAVLDTAEAEVAAEPRQAASTDLFEPGPKAERVARDPHATAKVTAPAATTATASTPPPAPERTTVSTPVSTPEPATVSTPVPAGSPPADEDLVHAVPPPWQRVNADGGFSRPVESPPAEQPAVDPVPERPVVTGTAAPRVFGTEFGRDFGGDPGRDFGGDPGRDFDGEFDDTDTRTPPEGIPALGAYPPPRATAHLENAAAMTGQTRAIGAAAPPNVLRRPGRGPRRANLQIKRFDPWSVLKLSLVLGVALFFVWLVAVGVLYAVLDGMGVWDKVNGISTDLLQGNGADSEPLISAGRVFGIAAIVGAVNIVLFSALATVGAFVYNVSADLAGGLEVTLAERE